MADRDPKRNTKPSTSAARKRQAAQRAMAAASGARAARRRRLLTVLLPVGIAVLVAGILVAVWAARGHSSKSGQQTHTAANQVVQAVTNVPAATLDAVKPAAGLQAPKSISGPPLTQGGKPRVLYVGAEYCPYCAAERWPMVVALSRFGTFAGLGQTASSPSDVFPDTATLSFHGATFTSDVIAFTGLEIYSNQVSGNGYTALDKLNSTDAKLFTTLAGGNFPFVDIGGKYVISGSSYDTAVLKGKTHAQIAAALADPTSAIGKAVDGTANIITAAICASTNDQPATVCTSPGVVAGRGKLSAG